MRRFGQARELREFTDELVDLSAFEDSCRAAQPLAFNAMGVPGAGGCTGVQASPEARLYMVLPAVP